jgi:hypothetical protein
MGRWAAEVSAVAIQTFGNVSQNIVSSGGRVHGKMG